jgi:hypothetical protein
MIECPHCFLRVIPTREGLCPACSGSTKSPDSKWSSISICPSTTLPRFCCVCNEPTSFVRRVKIGDWDRELEREEKQNGLGCLFTAIAIFNPIALLFRLVLLLAAFIVFVVQALIKSKAAVSHVVRIPLCTRCKSHFQVIEDTKDYMRIRVARSYSERISQSIPSVSKLDDPYAPPRSI